MNFKNFNLNNYILVKLSDEGFDHWQKEFNKNLPEKHRESISYFKGQQDAEGFVKMQAWEFMRTFGNSIRVGTMPVFDFNIKIQIE